MKDRDIVNVLSGPYKGKVTKVTYAGIGRGFCILTELDDDYWFTENELEVVIEDED